MKQLSLIPVCEIHGIEKVWVNDRQKKAGGFYRCRKCSAEAALKRYHASAGEENKKQLERRRRARAQRRQELMPASCLACGAPLEQRMAGGGQWKTKCLGCVTKSRRAATKKCREQNPDKYRDWQRKYNQLHRDDQRRWREENRERVQAWGIAYRQRRGDELRQAQRRFYEANKELFFSNNALRRAKCRESYAQLDAIDKAIIKAMYRKSRERGLAVDHIQPLFLDGGHVPWNLQLLTREQNSAKFCHPPSEREVLRGHRRYRLLRRVFERASVLGAAARTAA